MRVLLLTVLLAGCGGRLASTAGDLDAPGSVVFPQGWVGYSTTATMTLRNASASPRTVTLQVPAPFSVDAAEQRLQGGESRDLVVTFAPTEAGAYELDVKLSGDLSGSVHLSARANVPPACDAPNSCATSRFDPVLGQCSTAALPNGTSCADPCIDGGQCMNGVCMGTAKSCDDGNVCTADACGANGCVHTDISASCPRAADPCQAAYCDPVKGCQTQTVADGTSCGPNDCVTAHVCLQGSCQARPAPDGSVCAAQSICQGEGLCHAGACEQPAGSTLVPKWEYVARNANSAASAIAADDNGNVYFEQSIYDDCITCEVAIPGPICLTTSLDPNGVVRWAHQTSGGCLSFVIDSTHGRLIRPAGVGSLVEALALADGSQAWQLDLDTVNLRTVNKEPAGAQSRIALGMVLAGDTGPLYVAAYDAHSDAKWVLGVDRASGAMNFNQPYTGSLSQLAADAQGAVFTYVDESGSAYLERLGPQGQLALSQALPAGVAQLALDQFNAVLLLDGSGGLRWYDDNNGTAGTTLAAPLFGYYAADPYTVWAAMHLVYEQPNVMTNFVQAYDVTSGQLLAQVAFDPSATVSDLMVTDRGTSVLLLQDDSGLHGATSLFEADVYGRALMSCSIEHEGGNGALLVDGTLYVPTQTGVSAYDVPGYRLGRSGWVTLSGNPHRDGQAR